MKKIICLLYLILISVSFVFAQQMIYIRYTDPVIQYCARVTGYRFSTFDFEEFDISDSLSYVFFKQRIDSLKLCPNNGSCYFPHVWQQIIVVNGEEYDILSSNGVNAMEKNGRSVVVDKTLQTAINKAIEKHEKQLPPNKRIVTTFDEPWIYN
jgi:hypothetical protein